MPELDIFYILKNAYEVSTLAHNAFNKAISSIKWDHVFNADCETHFVKGGFTLSVENINPFAEEWKPTAFFSDGGVICF